MPEHIIDQTTTHRVISPDVGRPRTRTRADIVDGVADAMPELSRSDTRAVMETVLEEVAAALIKGDPVKFRGFGHFAVREKRERVGRNPRTGVEVPISPRRVLTFKASPLLVDKVNEPVANGADVEPV